MSRNDPFSRARPSTDARPRRVLYLDHTAMLGGGEIALFNLVRHLDRSRYEPIVGLFSEGPLADKLRGTGIETHILPLGADVVSAKKDGLGLRTLLRVKDVLAALAFTRRLAKFIQSSGGELVHTNSLKADLIGGVAARLARVPAIWHLRDRIADDYLPPLVARAFRLLCRVIPHAVVANSEATLRTLRLPPRQGTVVHSGVDLSGCPSNCEAPSSGGPVVGLVGRISRWKGQHIFIQAAADVLRRFPNARFQIIGGALFGEREYEAEVRALAVELGVDHAVHFAGFCNDVPARIAKMDLLVHASTTGEPFGQVVVEAMAAARPVVATDGGGVPEIVLDGVTGLLVPMGDAAAMAAAIRAILADPAAAAEMGRLGRRRVLERYTIERTVEKAQAIYGRLLQGARRRPRSKDEIKDPGRKTAADQGHGNPKHPVAKLRPRRMAVGATTVPDVGAAPAVTTANAHVEDTPSLLESRTWINTAPWMRRL